jgi:hypothetical protein
MFGHALVSPCEFSHGLFNRYIIQRNYATGGRSGHCTQLLVRRLVVNVYHIL